MTLNYRKHLRETESIIPFLALLDLVICAIIYKLTLSKESDTKLMVDKRTSQVFYVKNVFKRNAN